MIVKGITSAGGLSLIGVDVPALMQYIGNVTLIGHLAKFSVAFPFTYHYMCGIRHLRWDNAPDNLNTEYVTKSSYVLFISAALVSGVITVL